MAAKFDPASMAGALIAARRNRQQLDTATLSGASASLEQAYQVQRAVIDSIGPIGGYKTNRMADGTQVVAPIAASMVRPAACQFSANDFILTGAELELAFRLETPLPATRSEYQLEQLAPCFVALPVIEIVDSRLVNHSQCHFPLTLADNLSNGALVVGQPVPDWADLELGTPDHSFHAGDTLLSDGAGAVPGGSALTLLQGALAVIARYHGSLEPGQYITTGALSGAHWLTQRAQLRGEISGFGRVACTVERHGGEPTG